MHACMYIYMHTCMNTVGIACAWNTTKNNTRTHKNHKRKYMIWHTIIHIHTSIHIYTYTCIRMHVCTYIHSMYTCIHTVIIAYIFLRTHKKTHNIHTYMHKHSGDGTLRKDLKVWSKWSPAFGMKIHTLQTQIAMRGLSLLKVRCVCMYVYICVCMCTILEWRYTRFRRK